MLRIFRMFWRWLLGGIRSLWNFSKFVIAEFKKLEWLRLKHVTTILGLYAIIATVIGILMAAGILSAFPKISYRILPSILLVDPQEFYAPRYAKEPVPEGIVKIIENKKEEWLMFSTKKTVVPKSAAPEGWMFYDIRTGKKRINIGDSFFVRVGDVHQVKENLGFERTPTKKMTHLSDDQLSFWLEFLGWGMISDSLGRKINLKSNASEELPLIIEKGGKQRFDMWSRLWLASNVVSLILIENDSDLWLNNLSVAIRNSGQIPDVQPFLLFTPSQFSINYDQKVNRLDVDQIAPREQFVLLTISKSAVSEGDLGVTWDRFSEINIKQVVFWLLTAGVACLMLVILSLLPDYLGRNKNLIDQ